MRKRFDRILTMTIEGCELEYPRGQAQTVRRLFAHSGGGQRINESVMTTVFPQFIGEHRDTSLSEALALCGARILSEPP